MSSARDGIEMVLEDVYWIGGDAAKGSREPEDSLLLARSKADRIIAIVREALLADEAVVGGWSGYWDDPANMGSVGPEEVSQILSAAIDATFGKIDPA